MSTPFLFGNAQIASRLDPMTLSVVRYKLLAIVEEVVEVMARTCFSPVLNTSRDFSAAILDSAANLIAQAERVPIHMGALPFAVQSMVSTFNPEISEGDVLLANDPFWGGSHLPDITLAAPVFYDGEIFLWVSIRAHQGDIGGISPGGYSPSATEIWHEGVRLPPMKFVEAGKVRQDVLRMICANSRTPTDTHGDLLAQLSSVNQGVKRLLELFTRYGAAVMRECFDAILMGGERAMRAQIGQWLPGVYEGVSCLDSNELVEGAIPIRVKIRLDETSAEVDFSECREQVPSFVNSPLANTVAAVNVAFMYLSDSHDAQNGGSARAIRVVTRKGSIVDPVPPAPVAASTTLTASVIIETIMRALEYAAPQHVLAGFARRFRFAISGQDRNSRRFIWHHFANRGGAGAHYRADGWPNLGVMQNPGGSPSQSVERTESAYPFSVETYCLRPDSGGAGTKRGGCGGTYILRYEGGAGAKITPTGDGVENAPYGLGGGGSALPNSYLIERAGQRMKLGATDAHIELLPGDRIICNSAGGGGYGDPKLRPHLEIQRDVNYGYVSLDTAKRLYGFK